MTGTQKKLTIVSAIAVAMLLHTLTCEWELTDAKGLFSIPLSVFDEGSTLALLPELGFGVALSALLGVIFPLLLLGVAIFLYLGWRDVIGWSKKCSSGVRAIMSTPSSDIAPITIEPIASQTNEAQKKLLLVALLAGSLGVHFFFCEWGVDYPCDVVSFFQTNDQRLLSLFERSLWINRTRPDFVYGTFGISTDGVSVPVAVVFGILLPVLFVDSAIYLCAGWFESKFTVRRRSIHSTTETIGE